MRVVRDGITRTVYVAKHHVLKVPTTRYGIAKFLQGMLANMSERQTWKAVRYGALSDQLCPALVCGPAGLFLLMRRADPYPHEELQEAHKCDMTTDHKPDNYGLLNGKVVCIDYA